jgi:hypothetical protein
MKHVRAIAILALLCTAATAQGPDYLRSYCATKSTSLSGTAEVITIQQPATGAKYVRFSGASVYASVETGLTLERDGTAATSNTLTTAALSALSTASTATAWSASNVGSGTTLATYTVPVGQTLVLDLSNVWLIGDGTAKNLTLRTSAVTGTVKVNVCWEER